MFDLKKNILNKYSINTLWLMFEQILRLGVGFFIGIMVAKYLGPEEFGVFSYSVAFVGLFNGFVQLGLNQVVTKEIAKNLKNKNIYLGTAFWLKISSSIFAVLIIFLISNYRENDAIKPLIWILSVGMIIQSLDVIEYYFQSRVWGKYISICKVFQLTFSSLAKIILIILEMDVFYFVLLVLMDAIILGGLYIIAYMILDGEKFTSTFSCKISAILIRQSFPLFVGGLAFSLFSNIDAMIIKPMFGEASVGIYTVASRLASLWYFIPGVVLNAILPALVNVKENEELFWKRICVLAKLMFMASLVLVIFIEVFSNIIFSITYGADYFKSIEILNILIWSNIFIFINSCWNTIKTIEGNTSKTMYFHVTVVSLYIPLAIVLAKIYQLQGIAYALIISMGISTSIFFYYDKTLRRLIKSIFLVNH